MVRIHSKNGFRAKKAVLILQWAWLSDLVNRRDHQLIWTLMNNKAFWLMLKSSVVMLKTAIREVKLLLNTQIPFHLRASQKIIWVVWTPNSTFKFNKISLIWIASSLRLKIESKTCMVPPFRAASQPHWPLQLTTCKRDSPLHQISSMMTMLWWNMAQSILRRIYKTSI